MTRSAFSLVVAALLLNACSDPQPSQQPEQSVAEVPAAQTDQPVAEPEDEAGDDVQSGRAVIYRCDDGTEFELTVIGSSAHMELDNTSYELRQQPAASGIFHAGDLWQVHSKTETALLIGPDSTRECDQVATRQVDIPASSPAGRADSAAEDAEQGLE